MAFFHNQLTVVGHDSEVADFIAVSTAGYIIPMMPSTLALDRLTRSAELAPRAHARFFSLGALTGSSATSLDHAKEEALLLWGCEEVLYNMDLPFGELPQPADLTAAVTNEAGVSRLSLSFTTHPAPPREWFKAAAAKWTGLGLVMTSFGVTERVVEDATAYRGRVVAQVSEDAERRDAWSAQRYERRMALEHGGSTDRRLPDVTSPGDQRHRDLVTEVVHRMLAAN